MTHGEQTERGNKGGEEDLGERIRTELLVKRKICYFIGVDCSFISHGINSVHNNLSPNRQDKKHNNERKHKCYDSILTGSYAYRTIKLVIDRLINQPIISHFELNSII